MKLKAACKEFIESRSRNNTNKPAPIKVLSKTDIKKQKIYILRY